MKSILLSLAFLFTLQFAGQTQTIFDEVDWDENPSYVQSDSTYADQDEFMVRKKVYVEIYNEIVNGQEVLKHQEIVHTLIQVNTDKAIDENNKIFVRYEEGDELLQKARVILPSGKVIEVKEEDIFESEDEDDKGSKYFALEGLEIGAQIEHFYQRELDPNITGVTVYAQGQYPMMEYSYKLYHPSYLRFAHRAYNCEWEPISTEPSDERSALEWKTKDIPGVGEQPMSYYDAGMRRFSYKLDKNIYTGAANIINYKRLNENIYQQYMVVEDKKELKALKKMVKEMDLSDEMSQEERIRAVENYCKNNYTVFPLQLSFFGLSPNIVDIASNKITSKEGYVRLLFGLYTYLDIDAELVLTSSRSDFLFEEDFENYQYLDKYLIYFPDVKDFVAPNVSNSRLGVIPASWTDNFGLFCKPVSIAGVSSCISDIKFIPAPGMEANYDEMDITVALDFDEVKATATYHKTLTGIYAQNYQPEFPNLKDEEKEELEEGMATYVDEDAEVLETELTNVEKNDFGAKPLIHDFTIASESFLSVAGDKVLFSVGDLIGPQQELYLEKGEERILPVDVGYNHGYSRSITFDIPEGYEVKNLDELLIDVKYEREGEEVIAFESTYTLEGKTVTVNIEEFYKDHHFEVEEFEAFRSVINAAADFNKVVLVFGQM